MKMEQTDCSETSAYKIQMPGNYPEESIQYFSLLLCLNICCKFYPYTFFSAVAKALYLEGPGFGP